jgi:uncharacterized protein (TIGR03067 family)
MNRTLVVVSAALMVVGCVAPVQNKPVEATPVTGDLAKLQGLWEEEPRPDKDVKSQWLVKGNTVSFVSTLLRNGRKVTGTCELALDEQAKPHKTIDSSRFIRSDKADINGPDRVPGIYRFLDDDKIEICNGFDVRPSEFRDPGERQGALFTLKRKRDDAKPKD